MFVGGCQDRRPGDWRVGTANLVGFALSVPGTAQRASYLHSHMLAVQRRLSQCRPGPPDQAVSARRCAGRGFELMEWTFDPLEIKNAYFNIEKLGAIARRYNVNQYGITSSPLQGCSAHRPPGGGVVDEVEAGGDAAGERQALRFDREDESTCRPKFMIGRQQPGTAAAGSRGADRNREEFLEAFAEDWRVSAMSATPGNGVFLLGTLGRRLVVCSCNS